MVRFRESKDIRATIDGSKGSCVALAALHGRAAMKHSATLRVKACRLGYLDSDEIVKRYDSIAH
jgi:hypothetical protein